MYKHSLICFKSFNSEFLKLGRLCSWQAINCFHFRDVTLHLRKLITGKEKKKSCLVNKCKESISLIFNSSIQLKSTGLLSEHPPPGIFKGHPDRIYMLEEESQSPPSHGSYAGQGMCWQCLAAPGACLAAVDAIRHRKPPGQQVVLRPWTRDCCFPGYSHITHLSQFWLTDHLII